MRPVCSWWTSELRSNVNTCWRRPVARRRPPDARAGWHSLHNGSTAVRPVMITPSKNRRPLAATPATAVQASVHHWTGCQTFYWPVTDTSLQHDWTAAAASTTANATNCCYCYCFYSCCCCYYYTYYYYHYYCYQFLFSKMSFSRVTPRWLWSPEREPLKTTGAQCHNAANNVHCVIQGRGSDHRLGLFWIMGAISVRCPSL